MADCGVGAGPLAAQFIPNALGEIIAREWARLAEHWPGVKLLAGQVMEDHFHGVIATPSFMAKPLGAIIGSFKARASSEAGRSLWGKGYVDVILFDDEAVARGVAYTRDNPRRLCEKRAHPELFKVLRDVVISLGPQRGFGHFAAIGNLELLKAPLIYQVQCSRSFFEYRRDRGGRLLRNEPPKVATREFAEKREGFLEAAAKGAVLLSPCISHGEKEIAHLAFEKGLRVITLANKGFSPLYKPGGRSFDATAAGNLLMLAPAAWPYLPGEKKITRIDACILNRIAQWLSGSGAVEIRYRGIEPEQVDRLAAEAVAATVGEFGSNDILKNI